MYTTKKKKEKKSLVFSIKIMFDNNLLSNIKIHFYHFHSEILIKILIFNTNYQILY